MRTKLAIRNIYAGIIVHFLILVLNFIFRKYFIEFLGIEENGLYSLFNNLISLLSFTELGLGIAAAYSFYKPLEKKDEDEVARLLVFLKKFYKIIIIVICFVGLMVSMFLDELVKGYESDLNLIKVTFFVFILITIVTYSISHIKTLFIADQKNYILIKIQSKYLVFTVFLQILALFSGANFLIVMLISLTFKIIENLSIKKTFKVFYPQFVNIKNSIKLKNSQKEELKKNTTALIYHKIGSTVTNSTDNIIISSFIGISMVGIYSNYLLLISALNGFIAQFYNAITSTLGNYNMTEKKENKLNLFYNLTFMNYLVFSIMLILFYHFHDLIIEFWIGKEYVLSHQVIILILINFYFLGIRKVNLTFKNSMGLFYQDRFKAIFEAVINLFLSLFLVTKFGISGVLVGTILANLLTCFWIEPFVLFKYGFLQNTNQYFKKIFINILVVLLSFSPIYLIFYFDISVSHINKRLGLPLINIIFYLLFLFIFYKKSNELRFLRNSFKKIMKKYIQRG